jgi:hypothetical protein
VNFGDPKDFLSCQFTTRRRREFDSSDANKDLNGDGYTNIEKYLNGIDPTIKIDWRDPKNNIDPLTAPLRNPAK